MDKSFITTKQLKMKLRNKIEDQMDGLSYEQAAEKTGYTDVTIRNAVNKPSKVKLETMEEIWHLLSKKS